MAHIDVAFPLWLQLFGAVALGLVLLWMLPSMNWAQLFVPGRLHQFLVVALFLALIWSMRAESIDGLAMHFLGVVTVTLVFGWQLAIVMVALVVLVLALVGTVELLQVPLIVLMTGVLPVLVTANVLQISERHLPAHLFIYLYVVGFFGGGLSVLIVMGGNAAMYGLFTDLSWAMIVRDYLRYLPLMMLPEAVLNGMLMTGLVVFRPEWVATYSDARYVDGH